MAQPVIQSVRSEDTELTYIAVYEMTEKGAVDSCSVHVKQDKAAKIVYSIVSESNEITGPRSIKIEDKPNAKRRLSNIFKFNAKEAKEDRYVEQLNVTTESALKRSIGGNLNYDVVIVRPISGQYQLQVLRSTESYSSLDRVGLNPDDLVEPREPRPSETTEDRLAAAGVPGAAGSGSSASSKKAASSSLDAGEPAASSSLDAGEPAASSSLDAGEPPDTAVGTERRNDVGGSSGGSGTQAPKKKGSSDGEKGKAPAKPEPKKEPSVSKIRKAKSNNDYLKKAEYQKASIPLGRAGAEGTEPKNFTMVQTIPDPMGDRDGSKYNDPRYVFKKDVATTGDSGDYVGSDYEYNVWIDSSKIKTKADLKDENMPFVYFEIEKDAFDEIPYGVDRDRDFTGLKIYHDGSITGNKAGLKNDSFFNILYTYLELWNSYKEISNLPAAPDAAPAPSAPAPALDAPAPAPGTGPGDRGPDAGPDLDITVTPPAPGGGERKTGPCCHTGVKLDLACYQRTWTKYPNGVTPKDCDSIYREKAGNVPNFLRGIEKDGDEWLHYIKDKQTGNFVAVTTTGNTLLNYAQSASIKKIKIFKGGLGGFRDSAKTNDPEFNNVFRTLRTTIKDVRVFLPYDPSMGPDSCGLTDDEVFARTDWTIQLREDKQMRIIRRQIRNLLLSQRS